MIINRILDKELTLCQAQGNSKKRVLETIAELIHQHHNEIDAAELFQQLTARERLGSTAIGHGIAIPHCRCTSIESTIGCLLTLKEPVDFDAQDDTGVDIIFVLLVPSQATEEHLQTLSELASLLSQPNYTENLRKSQTRDELFNAATQFEMAA